MAQYRSFSELGRAMFMCPRPEPTTNAGRYLRQLEHGDRCFEGNNRGIDDELTCALKRIQITSSRQEASINRYEKSQST